MNLPASGAHEPVGECCSSAPGKFDWIRKHSAPRSGCLCRQFARIPCILWATCSFTALRKRDLSPGLLQTANPHISGSPNPDCRPEMEPKCMKLKLFWTNFVESDPGRRAAAEIRDCRWEYTIPDLSNEHGVCRRRPVRSVTPKNILLQKVRFFLPR